MGVDFSIIIPTYNESGNIQELVTRIQRVFDANTYRYEVLFVDDSCDDTTALLETLSQRIPEVRYVHREHLRGLGTAVIEGFQRSQGRYLIVMDADLQHPPETLTVLIHKLVQGVDIVIPSRFVAGGSDGGLSFFRRMVSWVARRIAQLCVKQSRPISDCTSGFFGLQRKVIHGISFNPISWKILMEILVKGNYDTINEIPYHFMARDVDESKMNLSEQWKYVQHIIKLAKQR